MSDSAADGCYRLRKGIRLMPAPGGGIMLQDFPLRALRVNTAAFDLLRRAVQGLAARRAGQAAAAHSFLDSLHDGGILTWHPEPPARWPFVSIVIPVYNRPADIETCLASLSDLEYPSDRLEVIVVDDASSDRTAAAARRFGVTVLTQPENHGQSAARNRGAAAARGDLIAFLDSDCTAHPAWLRELVPYFRDERIALVGGRVDSRTRRTALERYEAACSALDMGDQPVIGRGGRSLLYVPTCNMLVRKSAFAAVGGLNEDLRLGEDVDLCWRLMDTGRTLMYAPAGRVFHKHRNTWWSAFRRRFDYGTSEAGLYARFDRAAKIYPRQAGGLAFLAAVCAALVTASAVWLAAAAAILAAEAIVKQRRLARAMQVRLPAVRILAALSRGHLELARALGFYAVRYHLPGLLVLSAAAPALGLLLVLLPAWTAFVRRRPRLGFPVFLFFFLAEQAFYQAGALLGCIRRRSFRLYRITFRPVGLFPPSPAGAPAGRPAEPGRAAV